MYKISKYTKTIEKENRILIANVKSDKFIKVNKVYYEVLKEYIDKYGDIEILKKSLDDEKSISNIQILFNKLCDIRVIVENDDAFENETLNKVIINCTNRCNLHCTHCCNNSGIDNYDLLSGEKIKGLINVLIKYDIKELLFTGGEPLIRKDMLEILKYTRENYNGTIILNSNGLLINNNNVEELKKYVDIISISLDGVDEKSTALIRGKGVFDKAINSIKLLKEKGFEKVSASMVITKNNEDLCQQFIDLCKSLDIHPMLRKFDDVGRGNDNKKVLSGSMESLAVECNEEPKCQVCRPGQTEIYIENDGNIYPCQMLTDKSFCLGNVIESENTLESILLHGERIYELINSKRPYNDEKCKNCDVNLFCWGCLGDYLRVGKDIELFNVMCKYKMDKLKNMIW